MKILAFIGTRVPEQKNIISEMAKGIAPEYRVLMIRLDNVDFADGKRMNILRRRCADGIPPDTVLVVCGVSSVEEFDFLQRNHALFCLLPGSLPRLMLRHDIPIDESFLFVTSNPDKLESAAKRRLFCDPVSAFSRVLVAELERRRARKEVIFNAR